MLRLAIAGVGFVDLLKSDAGVEGSRHWCRVVRPLSECAARAPPGHSCAGVVEEAGIASWLGQGLWESPWWVKDVTAC